MEKIEIKYNKKNLILIILFFTAGIVASTYLVFFTDKFAEKQAVKWLLIPANLFGLYMVYTQGKKLLENRPIVTLTRNYIELNEDGRPLIFSWTEIKDLRIEKQKTGKSDSDVLTIKSDAKMGEINISTLDRSADDIAELIKNYRAVD